MYSDTSKVINSILAFTGVFFILFLLLLIAFLIVYIFGLIKLYQKAGKSGWEAIVPFYNSWILVEISGLTWWWFLIVIASSIVQLLDLDELILMASLAGFFGRFCCYYNLSKKFHKDISLAILMTFFPFVMIPIVGFSDSYQFDHSVNVDDVWPFNNTKKQLNQSDSITSDANASSILNESNHFCPNCGCAVSEQNTFCKKCGTKLK